MPSHRRENRNKEKLSSRLTEQVTLQTPTRTSDGAGGYSTSWGTLDTVWAEVSALNGREIFRQQQRQSHRQFRVVIRWREDVTTGMRVGYQSDELEILAVITDDPTRTSITLLCEKRE